MTDTHHADFSDLALTWPLLRQAGQLGSVPGERMIEILNDAVLHFLDRYLKSLSTPNLMPEEYPEIKMEMKYKVQSRDGMTTVTGAVQSAETNVSGIFLKGGRAPGTRRVRG